MRLAIDLQGAQTESRYRGIGRYSLSIAKAIVQNRGKHEVFIVLNGLFADTIEPIRGAFHKLSFPQENIRVWSALGPTKEIDPGNAFRREAAEYLREAFIASLCPDVVLVTSLFEGLGDDAVTSVNVFDKTTPSAVVLYDLIPLINPDEHYRSSPIRLEHYARKIESLKRSHLLLAISQSAKHEALTALSFADERVVNVSGACDESFFPEQLEGERRQQLYRKFRIDKPYVMYTGGADERKNLARLIEAFATLPDDVRLGHQLLMVGKMPSGNVEILMALGVRQGLRENDLVFSGYVDDDELRALYSGCKLFVFPSLHEGFGIPPLEAMRCGAPAIGADATSLPEVLGTKEALFDPQSVDSIRNKIYQVLTDSELRQRLIRHGREHATRFSWDSSAKATIDALEKKFGSAPVNSASYGISVQESSLFRPQRKKILLIKLDHMGDFLLAVPAISKVRARYPYATIDIVVGSWNVEIANQLNVFSSVYVFDFFKRKSSETPTAEDSELKALLQQLDEYDLALDLRRQTDTRFVLANVRARCKVGYATFDQTVNSALDITLPTHADVPHITTPLNSTSISLQMMKLVDAVPENINDFISIPLLAGYSEKQKGYVAIFPAAGNEVKEWGFDNYSALVESLAASSQVRKVNIYVTSSAEGKRLNFARNAKVQIHVGLQFTKLVESLSENIACVANNSFGAHLASYLGLTVFGLYGGHETVAEWGPVFGESYVAHTFEECSPCHIAQLKDCKFGLACMRDIPVIFVQQKIIELLVRASSTGAKDAAKLSKKISVQIGPTELVNKLVRSLTELGLNNEDVAVRAKLATAIAENHPPRKRARQMFVDISELVKGDARSGIQRVVRSVLFELLTRPANGLRVEPVYANTADIGYRYARAFATAFLGKSGDTTEDDFVDAYPGDIFLGLDLQPATVQAQRQRLLDWHRRGVSVHFVVYDLLPILLPGAFPKGAQSNHECWLETVCQFDSAICISQAVAVELKNWSQTRDVKRERPFEVSWFHLGADVRNSMPTAGLASNAKDVIHRISTGVTFLMVGTVEPRKGHRQVLAAFEQLWANNVNVSLVIVGKQGWMVEELVRQLRGHIELGKRLYWLEGISDEYLEMVYRASTCLIAASEGEGFGLPLAEAAQYGLPIIARDIEVFREIGRDGAQYFENSLEPKVLAAAIQRWLDLYKTSCHPSPNSVLRLTWTESVNQLVDAVVFAKKSEPTE